MRIRFTRPNGYGDRYGVEHKQGELLDAPDALAAKLIANGIAEAAPESPKTKAPAEVVVETAAVAAPQNAAKRTGKAQPRKKA